MARIRIRFTIPTEEELRLKRLVHRFGGGNRSVFLRVAMTRVEIVDRAERLAELAVYGADRLAATRIAADDIPEFTKQVLSTHPS